MVTPRFSKPKTASIIAFLLAATMGLVPACIPPPGGSSSSYCKTCSGEECASFFGPQYDCDIIDRNTGQTLETVRVMANSEDEAERCAKSIAERRGYNDSTVACAIPQGKQSGEGESENCATCDNEACGEATDSFIFGVLDPTTKCGGYETVQANSKTKAEDCIRARNREPVDARSVRTFYFAVYLAWSTGGYECSTVSVGSTSEGSKTCATYATGCSNCIYRNITNEVSPDGVNVNGGVLSNWCDQHPVPD